jgi:hypothetical protein
VTPNNGYLLIFTGLEPVIAEQVVFFGIIEMILMLQCVLEYGVVAVYAYALEYYSVALIYYSIDSSSL